MHVEQLGIARMDRCPITVAGTKSQHRADLRAHLREKVRLAVDNVSARSVASGQIRGTPRYALIEKRGVSLRDAEDKLAAILTRMGGADPFRGTVQAIIVEARAAA